MAVSSQNLPTPPQPAEEVNRSVGTHLVERLFEGSLADAVSHLLTSRAVSRAELDQLEKLIKDAKRRAK